MQTLNDSLKVIMNLTKVQAYIARKFDRLNVHGIGFSDFMILSLLQQAPAGKMRRIDLADKIGITASGVTRQLLPMEQRGLVIREANERDARVSFVVLSSAGQQLFEDAAKTANALALELFPAKNSKDINVLTDILAKLGGDIN